MLHVQNKISLKSIFEQKFQMDLFLIKNNYFQKLFNILYIFLFVQPISFALIGKELLVSKLNANVALYGVLIICIGCCVRIKIANC